MTTQLDNKQRILQVAEGLIQTKGYNAFSYRDISMPLLFYNQQFF